MARKMVWVKRIHNWACSECAWVFVSSGQIVGDNVDEMTQHFAAQRDKEFMSHVCIKQTRTPAQELGLPKKTE
jgi:hypothetical protein